LKINYKNKNNIVYTYYEEINMNRGWMLDYWKKSWQKNGWETVILNENNAKKHPKYKQVLNKINTMPTVNTREYENACYLRWVAMACIGGLMTDIDVININYKPTFFEYYELECYEYGRVPCMVSGSKKEYERVIQWILDWRGDTHHISDMYLFIKNRPLLRNIICEQYNGNNSSPTIHCSYGSCGNNREGIIRGLCENKI